MKTFLRITILFASIFTVAITAAMAQRVIKGTVYMDGTPAAGMTVEAHKGSSMMTSFDGKYEVEADAKSKYIKFTFIDDSQKLDIEGKSENVFDYAFSGSIPTGEEEAVIAGVSLKSADQLMEAKDKDFMNELSLYREFFKQGDYVSAMPHLRKLYDLYPKSTINLYLHGAKIMESFINVSKTDAERDENLNKLMKIYDARIKHFGNKGYVLGRKGTSFLKYKLDAARDVAVEGEELKEVLTTGYEWLIECLNDQGDETELPILVLVMQTSRSLLMLGTLPKETMVVNYEKCNSIVNSVIANSSDADMVKSANDVQVYIEDIFGKSGAADCEALVNIFTPQFAEKGADAEFVKNMLRRLRRAKCDESDLYKQATEKLYELDPSAEAAFNMAHTYLKLGDLEKAKGYYKQAMAQETDQELLSTYYYEYGLFIYAKENALSEARDYARKALAINANYCEANMLIGDIYVAATRSFEGTNLEKAAVFWVVVDYYNKARRNEDCAVDASQKAASYKKYFPNKEDAFMDGLQEGKAYKVGGWINESTTVRF